MSHADIHAHRKNKILVVDDDDSILDAVSLILEERNYIVETTFKGEDTYRKARTFNPDVILLDVLMSGKDGREICKNLKNHPETKHIPVIMISAHPSAMEGAKSSGADDFLAKPFAAEELFKKIESAIR